MKIDKSFLENLDSRNRVNLAHSLSGFSPAVLVGTKSTAGEENVSIFSSLIHLGSNPPLFGLKFRPQTVARHTLENILETKVFTINHVDKAILDAAHQSSAKYAREQSEFEKTSLNKIYLDEFKAPYVLQSSIKMAMSYREHHKIKSNDTIFLVAELMTAYIEEQHLTKDYSIQLDHLEIVALNGLYNYYQAKHITKKDYAKI